MQFTLIPFNAVTVDVLDVNVDVTAVGGGGLELVVDDVDDEPPPPPPEPPEPPEPPPLPPPPLPPPEPPLPPPLPPEPPPPPEPLEPHDTVNVTYMFMLVGVTVVLDGLMVQPGAVLAVNWALVPGG
jgi:hypothetical protein